MIPLYFPIPDRRLDFLSQLALSEGARLLSSPKEPCAFLFPPNAKKDAVLPYFNQAHKGSLFVLGRRDDLLCAAAAERGVETLFLLEEPCYLASNSRCTAEGVLAQVIEHTTASLSDLCVLIYGYGNCGKEIARLLWLCGCQVWVWSRERGQRLAQNDGFNLHCAPALGLSMFDVVIGTVPEPIYSPSLLSTMRPGSIFFQVASSTSGIDEEILSKNGVSFLPLPALPARFTPLTEADAIYSTLKEYLSEKEGTPL